ncbi:hypothetical protein EK21DRAFT_57063 [Setomelanomma holmii]|uniref:LYR motif-containing protein Cup1-like N-terminal domain-containing protein n=1 Tax=Setomelanomma holmii TaxID=210430 RepID=A0A9P4LNR9_9PLEO|nr:hypothetical protein EK21DRAFT_57063 [Setomelanomma holmii]
MSASSLPAASHTKSIHLLRALLREATYLPDAVARNYFRTYIVDRFRAYQPKHNGTASLEQFRHRHFKRRQLSIITERTSKLQKQAQKGLHYLRRANQGEIPCLQKVLFFAYGRMGKRKYALLNDLLKPNPIMDGDQVLAPVDFNGPTRLQTLYYSNKQYLQYFDAPKAANNGQYVINISDRFSRLRAVLKSQYQHKISIRRELKSPAMKTPIHNIWLRPMPIVRARNNVRRWYAETMTRLLPPLPPQEWDDIQAMISGQQKIGLVKRRVPTESEALAEASDVIAEGMRMDRLSKADRPAGMWRPHNIIPRYMRRMYSRILRLCCKVEYDSERKQWTVTWGEAIQPISPRIYQTPSDEALFAGVDAKGKLVKQPSVRKEKQDVHDDHDLQPRDAEGKYVRFPFYTEFLPRSNPLRMQLEIWQRKRRAAGIIDEDSTFRGR